MLKHLAAFLATVLLTGVAHAQHMPLPIISTDAGAQAIVLQQLSMSVEVSGGMAATSVRMVFHNPNNRPLEGNLQFPLLDGQHVTAFALDIDGAMRPAVPVEKAKGREVVEAIERRQVDPGLLEVTQGNNFKLRVYPIPPHMTRTVELTYAESLSRRAGQWTYRLPLGFGQVRDFDLSLKVSGTGPLPVVSGLDGAQFSRGPADMHAHVHRHEWTSDGLLEMAMEAPLVPRVYRQERDGQTFFVAEVPVESKRAARAAPRVIGLLWDSSGSGARRLLDAELRELDRYFRALGNVEVRLVRLRDKAEAVAIFKIKQGDWSSLRRALETTVYDGATNLNDWTPQPEVDQYLLVSDGLSNYGSGRFPSLSARQRLFALNSATSADTARLSALAEQHGGVLATVNSQAPGSAADALLYQETQLDRLEATGAADLEVESHTVQGGLLRIAGRVLGPDARLALTVSSGGKATAIDVPLAPGALAHPLAATTWAGYRLHRLEADYEAHRAEIMRLGRRFAMATRETSLIVLDRLDDYLRYDIEPPAMYAEAFKSLRQVRGTEAARLRQNHLDTVVGMFKRRTAWWNTSYPLANLPLEAKPDAALNRRQEALREVMPPPPPPPSPMAPAPAPAGGGAQASRVELTGSRARGVDKEVDQAHPAIGIALKKWVPNAPYIERLRSASADTAYAVYLDEKPDYANSSAFFLDAADILLEKGKRELALRVLSNLAEMDLENRAVLRILGYRLLQAGAPRLAVPVFEEVLRIAAEEPQSFRDLGLAYAAVGQQQRAVDRLYEVVERPWDPRFPEIELIVLAEINAIVANAGKPLDVSRIDPRLRANLPLDLRVVMTWDADNCDMDLWVTDPAGEKSYYGNPLSRHGARMSRDFTQGYGPEEFSVRRARPGVYQIEANYYGNRQQVLAGATTVQVKLFTGFGTPRQKEQVITLRLKDRQETVYVGEFEVKPGAL